MANSDGELVKLAKGGDFSAFEELVNRHEDKVYSVALNILGNREDAQDAVQSAFIKAMEGLPGFREEASFATWITRIAANTALKTIRKNKKAADPRSGGDGDILFPETISDWRFDPSEKLETKELRRILDSALSVLSEKNRIVFVLRDIEGLSTCEAAELLDISEAAVKVRLLRARLQLRENLTEVFDGETARINRDHSHKHEKGRKGEVTG